MVMTDPIADLLTRIRNANMIRCEVLEVPNSKIKKEILRILLNEGYIKSYEDYSDGVIPMIKINLKYGRNNEKVITGLREFLSQDLEYIVRKIIYHVY